MFRRFSQQGEHRTDKLRRSGIIRPAQVLSAGCARGRSYGQTAFRNRS